METIKDFKNSPKAKQYMEILVCTEQKASHYDWEFVWRLLLGSEERLPKEPSLPLLELSASLGDCFSRPSLWDRLAHQTGPQEFSIQHFVFAEITVTPYSNESWWSRLETVLYQRKPSWESKRMHSK